MLKLRFVRIRNIPKVEGPGSFDQQLPGLLDRLAGSGKAVIVIEHHQAVIAHAGWIIDLGPGAGHDGGPIVWEGTPRAPVRPRATSTASSTAAAPASAACSRPART